MRRLALTVVTTFALSCAGVLYAQFTRPMLRVTALPPEAFEQLDPPVPSPEFSDMATRFLSTQSWAADAPYRHRDEDTFVYSRDYLLANEKRSVLLTPFAVVMAENLINGKEKVPITMVAESAQMNFSTSLTDTDFDVGHVTSGQLLGEVRFEGPDDLLIIGRDFFVDESSRRIWSDDIVLFRFGPHRGRGRGVELRLANGDVKDGLLAAESIRTVRVREDIVLELLEDGESRTADTKPTELIHVNSRGHLEFDLETNIATLERDINVRKPTAPGMDDTLKCELLNIHFRKTKNASAEDATDRLKPVQMTAQGSVELQSMENELWVTQITDLNYLLEERVIELSNSMTFSDGRGHAMKIVQQNSDMVCQRLILVHDEDNQIQSVRCPGAGLLKSHSEDKANELALVARWAEELVMEPGEREGVRVLRISGQAVVQQPAEKSQLSAQAIRMWFRERSEPRPTEQTTGTTAFAGTKLEPIRLEAEQDVRIISPRLTGPTNRLEVLFDQEAVVTNGTVDRERLSPPAFKGRTADRNTATKLGDKKFNVRSETIQVVYRAEPGEDQSEMPEVRLNGQVFVKSVDSQEKMTLTGDSLHVLEDASGNQTMKLVGSNRRPAVVRQMDRQIEGTSIFLERAANKAEVIGKGTLKFVVTKDFEGKELADPEPLEIVWVEGMTFDGVTAHLRGRVTATLGDGVAQRQELVCPEMRVHFTETISFTEGLNGGDESKLGKLLRSIECLGGVTVNSFEFSEGRTLEERHGSFRSIDINQQTGNTVAAGPGWITSWTQDRPRLSKAVSARANASAQARESAWNYTRIDFLGKVNGNFHQRTTTFNRDVAIVYGPVDRLAQVVDPDSGPGGELPEGAVRMTCDQLEITERGAKKGQRTMELLASGNAELDGRKVHAEADDIKYDERKELFTVVSHGNRMARLWQRERVGSPWRDFVGRRFDYSERNQGFKGSSVVGGGGGL